jgi:FKBP-type peptidyl-prolyl cis-trans isomerase SlyD
MAAAETPPMTPSQRIVRRAAGAIRKTCLLFFLVPPFLLISGRNLQAEPSFSIQDGDTVTFHYTLTVNNRVEDRSISTSPLTYVQGAGQLIPGLEEKMPGLKKGDKRRITVLPEKGYGSVNPDAFQNVPRKTFKNRKALKLGSIVTGQYNGRSVQATVIGMSKKDIILDLNHPLAGKTLQFDIEVMDVKRGSK